MAERSERIQHGLDVYDGMTANTFDNRFSSGLRHCALVRVGSGARKAVAGAEEQELDGEAEAAAPATQRRPNSSRVRKRIVSVSVRGRGGMAGSYTGKDCPK